MMTKIFSALMAIAVFISLSYPALAGGPRVAIDTSEISVFTRGITTCQLADPKIITSIASSVDFAINALGHGAISAEMFNDQGEQVIFQIRNYFDDVTRWLGSGSVVFASPVATEAEEGPLTEDPNNRLWFTSPANFSNAEVILTVRGAITDSIVRAINLDPAAFLVACDGKGFAEITVPFKVEIVP